MSTCCGRAPTRSASPRQTSCCRCTLSQVGDPLVAGYRTFATDVGALLGAHNGELLRLRFAETDNLAQLQLGVDNVAIGAAVTPIPEPTTAALLAVGLAAVLARRTRGARSDRRS